MAEPSTQKSTASNVETGRPDILSAGTRSKEILDLQQRLLKAGFDTGPPDGIYGPRTADAVRRFQEAVGLWSDGLPGPETERQLELYLDLRNPTRPLPDPRDNHGKPLLLDVINVIRVLEDPLQRLRRLLEMMERAQEYEDTRADAEARRLAFNEARQALGGEQGTDAAHSEQMKRLLEWFEAHGDDRSPELKKLMEDAIVMSGGRTAGKTTKGRDDSSGSVSATPSRAAAKATPKIVTDIWNREDQLGYAAYARALGALITHHETMPPLTIGIKAPWGAGKTSLMRMVQALLDGEPEHTGMSAHDRRAGAVTDAGSIAVDGDWQTGVRFKELFSTLEKPSEPTERVLPVESEPGTAFKIQPRVTVWFNA